VSRVDRHVFATLCAAIAVVAAALLGLSALFSLVEELRERAPSYGAAAALAYVGLTLPRRTGELMPYATFIGAVAGLGHLAAHGALTVLRASGMSIPRLFRAAAFPALAALAVGVALVEFAAPRAESAAAALKSAAKSTDRGGRWLRDGDTFLRIDSIAADGMLSGVAEYRFDSDGRLVCARSAAHAARAAGTAALMLHDVRERIFLPDAARTASAARRASALGVDPGEVGEFADADSRRLSTAALARRVAQERGSGREGLRDRLVLWTRYLQPVAVLTLTALAVAFVLGPLRDVGIGARLTAGVAAGLAFKYLQDLFAPFALLYGTPPLVAVGAPILVCALVAAAGWRRAR
jgi:lipopolysaccharide export system permease protein